MVEIFREEKNLGIFGGIDMFLIWVILFLKMMMNVLVRFLVEELVGKFFFVFL